MLKKKVESEAKPRGPLDVTKMLSIWKSGNPMREAGKRLFAAAGKKLRGINFLRSFGGKRKSDAYEVEKADKEDEAPTGLVAAASLLGGGGAGAAKSAWPATGAGAKSSLGSMVGAAKRGGGDADDEGEKKGKKRREPCCIFCGVRMC